MTSFDKSNLFLGQLPTRIFVAFGDSIDVNGQYTKSPFNFKHFSLNFLSLYLDSQSVPSQPLTPNFPQNQCMRSFHKLMESFDMLKQDKGLLIDRKSYRKGYTISGFQLTPEGRECSYYFKEIRQGDDVRLEARFTEALPNAATVILYVEFQNLLETDAHRNVLFDYSS